MNNFEINPGIVISKLDLKENDTIVVTIDTDKWDLMRATEMLYAYKDIFPNNKVVGALKGMEINKNDKSEIIEMLTLLKEQAHDSGANTFIWDINLDSFNFVIDKVIKELTKK